MKRSATVNGWAVKIFYRNSGRFGFALGSEGVGPVIYPTRKAAKAFAEELKTHGLQASPIKASVAITVDINPAAPPRRASSTW